MNWDVERLLVQKSRGGDREALGLLWDEFTPKLFGYLVNNLKNKSVAEDVLQSTWLKVIQALPNFKQRNMSISSWLFAIAHNECCQYWRKAGREVGFDPLKHDQVKNENEQTENSILVDQILHLLSEDDRELIRLRFIAGLAISEISKVLNKNSVAVRVQLHRALNKAKSLINLKHSYE